MFGFIAFTFKVVCASIVGFIVAYILNDKNNHTIIVNSTLITTFSATIMSLAKNLSGMSETINGFGVVIVIIVALKLSSEMQLYNKIIWIFNATIGMIIGAGFLLYSIIVIGLIYIIINNNEYFVKYMKRESEEINDPGFDNFVK